VNDEQIEQMRQKLLKLRSELQALEETARHGGETVELDQSRVGRLSRMDALQAQQMARESTRRRKQQQAKIEGALRRIASGGYGYCFVCREPIDARRLIADPTHTRCMACADKA
jgi:DnaK suppressor protein